MAVEQRDFALPEDEARRRWSAIQKGMSRAGLEAILLTSEHNVEYVTGLRTPAWLIKARPMCVVVPVQGEPVPVLPASTAADLQASGLFKRLRVYRGLESEAVTELIAHLRDDGLAQASIGIESGQEQRLGLPLAEFQRLGEAFPRARLADAAEVIWSARMVKSELEIGRLAHAGRITGEVYDALLAVVDEKWTERRVFAEFATGCIDRGADGVGYVTMTAGPHHYAISSSRARERFFEPGELFWMDGGCVYGSYFSDYTRCGAVGNASPAQNETYRRLYEVFRETLSVVRAGLRAAAVLEAATRAAAKAGVDLVIPTRVGHGVGLDVTEPPSLASRETADLQAGMTLAVEVGVMTDQGWFHLEDNVVVREGGCEFLSFRPASELPVLTGGPEPRRIDG
jgi:Xaa-Pro dipeptidase